MDKIQAEDIRATVLPRAVGDSFALVQQECTAACDLLGGTESGDVAKALDPIRVSAQVQDQVATLRSEASIRASFESCHRSALSIAQSQMTLMARLADFEICLSALQESSEHGPDSPTRSAPRATASRRRKGSQSPSR